MIFLISRDIPNFLATTSSCGRPLPHRKISGLKGLQGLASSQQRLSVRELSKAQSSPVQEPPKSCAAHQFIRLVEVPLNLNSLGTNICAKKLRTPGGAATEPEVARPRISTKSTKPQAETLDFQ